MENKYGIVGVAHVGLPTNDLQKTVEFYKHPDEDLAKKMGVPGAEAVGILTLSPREAAMIAGDFATKAFS